MSQVLAGFVGAIAGALATIGTQGTLARLDRRNASRASARLLFGDLTEARDIMVASLSNGEWETRRELDFAVTSWQENREAIARAVGSKGFHAVAGAFKAVEFVAIVRERNRNAPDRGFGVASERMIDAIPRCDVARLVLAQAGCTTWERYVTVRPKVEGVREFAI